MHADYLGAVTRVVGFTRQALSNSYRRRFRCACGPGLFGCCTTVFAGKRAKFGNR